MRVLRVLAILLLLMPFIGTDTKEAVAGPIGAPYEAPGMPGPGDYDIEWDDPPGCPPVMNGWGVTIGAGLIPPVIFTNPGPPPQASECEEGELVEVIVEGHHRIRIQYYDPQRNLLFWFYQIVEEKIIQWDENGIKTEHVVHGSYVEVVDLNQPGPPYPSYRGKLNPK